MWNSQEHLTVAAVYDRRIISSNAIIPEFEIKNFTHKRPLVPLLHESGAHRILANIIPLC